MADANATITAAAATTPYNIDWDAYRKALYDQQAPGVTQQVLSSFDARGANFAARDAILAQELSKLQDAIEAQVVQAQLTQQENIRAEAAKELAAEKASQREVSEKEREENVNLTEKQREEGLADTLRFQQQRAAEEQRAKDDVETQQLYKWLGIGQPDANKPPVTAGTGTDPIIDRTGATAGGKVPAAPTVGGVPTPSGTGAPGASPTTPQSWLNGTARQNVLAQLMKRLGLPVDPDASDPNANPLNATAGVGGGTPSNPISSAGNQFASTKTTGATFADQPADPRNNPDNYDQYGNYYDPAKYDRIAPQTAYTVDANGQRVPFQISGVQFVDRTTGVTVSGQPNPFAQSNASPPSSTPGKNSDPNAYIPYTDPNQDQNYNYKQNQLKYQDKLAAWRNNPTTPQPQPPKPPPLPEPQITTGNQTNSGQNDNSSSSGSDSGGQNQGVNTNSGKTSNPGDNNLGGIDPIGGNQIGGGNQVTGPSADAAAAYNPFSPSSIPGSVQAGLTPADQANPYDLSALARKAFPGYGKAPQRGFVPSAYAA